MKLIQPASCPTGTHTFTSYHHVYKIDKSNNKNVRMEIHDWKTVLLRLLLSERSRDVRGRHDVLKVILIAVFHFPYKCLSFIAHDY